MDEIRHLGSQAGIGVAPGQNPQDRISLCERGDKEMCMAVADAFYNGNDGASP